MKKDTNLESLKNATDKLQEIFENPETPAEDQVVDEEVSEAASTSEESTEIESSTPSTEVNQDVNLDDKVDSKGVPYKNRYSEAERKLKQAEAKLAEATAKIDELSKQSEEQALASLRGASYDNNAISTSRPKREEIEEAQVAQEDYSETPATVQTVEQIVAKFAAKERNDQEALKRYPDLYNTNSVFYKETLGRINAKKRAGVNANDPLLLIETADAVFGALVATGRIVPKTTRVANEVARRAGTDEATVISSRTVVKNKSEPALSRMDQFVLTQFKNQAGVKMTPEQFLKSKTRTK